MTTLVDQAPRVNLRRGRLVLGALLVLLFVCLLSLLLGTRSVSPLTVWDAPRAFDYLRFADVGSLAGRGGDVAAAVAPFILIGLVLSVASARSLNAVALGDDMATALGVRVERARLIYLALGVALIAVCTAAAGPIAFVALAAPQLAQRLTGSAGIALVPAAAMGALLLIVSDWVAQRAFAPTQLPVGVVTVTLGGAYFAWMLARAARTD